MWPKIRLLVELGLNPWYTLEMKTGEELSFFNELLFRKFHEDNILTGDSLNDGVTLIIHEPDQNRIQISEVSIFQIDHSDLNLGSPFTILAKCAKKLDRFMKYL